MSKQNPLTLVTPIRKEKLTQLKDILRKLKLEIEAGKMPPFDRIGTVHYLRWIIIDDNSSKFFEDTERDPQLVMSSNFDGSVDQHYKDLVSAEMTSLFDSIYDCCEGYGDKQKASIDSRVAFLKKYTEKVSAFYKGSPKRSVKTIHREKKLRIKLRKELNNSEKWNGLSSREIHRKLKQEVLNDPEFVWAKKGYRMPHNSLLKFILLCLVLLILAIPIAIWVLILQLTHENKDEYFVDYRSDIPEKKTKILEKYEDLVDGINVNTGVKDQVINYQNQFSQLVVMKSGWMRRMTFKGMMLFARVLIPIKYVEGELLNIPTIHFARWVLFDDDKRVLFFSNFDGSWQQYLGDFIDQSGWGLSAIFSNTTRFPKTNFLGFGGLFAMSRFAIKSGPMWPGGAYDEEHFLAWSRSTELPTDMWYSAYPQLSIKNVNNNSRIRTQFAKNLSEKQAEKFFQLI